MEERKQPIRSLAPLELAQDRRCGGGRSSIRRRDRETPPDVVLCSLGLGGEAMGFGGS
jgi:hypothetical protein